MNTNTNVADIHQVVLKIDQDMSKIRGDAGSQNKVVCDTRIPYHLKFTLTVA